MMLNPVLEGKTISVLGCGWLGFPLAETLVKLGAKVKGSTTSRAKLAVMQQAGISPFLIDLGTETPVSGGFMEANVLVISIPPKARNADFGSYLNQLKKLASAIEKAGIERLIFISSTGVYPEGAGTVTEEYAGPHSGRARALLEAEQLMRQIPGTEATVVRFGGLFGPGRHPGKFLAGKINEPNGNAPVNSIHQADAVQVIIEIIEQNAWGRIFNACAPLHPTRAEFYTSAALHAGVTPPQFMSPEQRAFTFVNSTKMAQALSYSFKFPDPLAAIATLPLPVNAR